MKKKKKELEKYQPGQVGEDHQALTTYPVGYNSCVQLTIIPRACVGYEMINNQPRLAITISYLTSTSRIIVLLNNQEISLRLADSISQGRPEEDLMAIILWAWYNGCYLMAAKPIKTLELHYSVTSFQ